MNRPASATARPDRCPRCGAAFACGVAGPGPCACSGVALDTATLIELQQLHPGRCLCLDCLMALAKTGPGGTAARP